METNSKIPSLLQCLQEEFPDEEEKNANDSFDFPEELVEEFYDEHLEFDQNSKSISPKKENQNKNENENEGTDFKRPKVSLPERDFDQNVPDRFKKDWLKLAINIRSEVQRRCVPFGPIDWELVHPHFDELTSLAELDIFFKRNFPDQFKTSIHVHVKEEEDRVFCLSAKLRQENNETYLDLLPIKSEASCRFYRKYGASRFFKVSFDSTPFQIEHLSFSLQKFHLLGCTWRLFSFGIEKKKKQLIYFAEEGVHLDTIPIQQIRDWHIPLSENQDIHFTKFISRFALGFSNTKPSIKFPYKVVDDLKAEGGVIMNDGCERIDERTMRKIREKLKLPRDITPSAIQGRVGPCKGLWCLDLKVTGPQVNHSMIKYNLPNPEPDFQDIFEVCDYSHDTGPADMNYQFVQVLLGLGIPQEVFSDLIQEAADRIAACLETPEKAKKYLDKVCKSRKIPSEDKYDDFYEAPLLMLKSGFDFKNAYLVKRLQWIVNVELEKIKEKVRIPVEKSRWLFMIPDFSGTLKPNEVYINISGTELDEYGNERTIEVLTGEVLIARNPCNLPSDVRKFQAVNPDEDSGFPKHLFWDVVVFSIHPIDGHAPADFLSGGDYDGDRAWCCWDKRLMNFQNHPLPAPLPENDPHIHEIRTPIKSIPLEDFENFMLDRCLEFQTNLGRITLLHMNWADVEGLCHSRSIYLGQLCQVAVDSFKSGKFVTYPHRIQMEFLNKPMFSSSFRTLPIPDWFKSRFKSEKVPTYYSKSGLGYIIRKFYDVKFLAIPQLDSIDRDLLVERESYLVQKFNPKAESDLKRFNSAYYNYKRKENEALKNNSPLQNEEKKKAEEEFNQILRDIKHSFRVLPDSEKKIMASCMYERGFRHSVANGRTESSFAYSICLDYLIRLKADNIQNKINGRAALTLLE